VDSSPRAPQRRYAGISTVRPKNLAITDQPQRVSIGRHGQACAGDAADPAGGRGAENALNRIGVTSEEYV
jgi:hypothetical protein